LHGALILLIDNFDSFTHNLQDYLLRSYAEVLTVRYNELPGFDWKSTPLTGVVISPGPGHPLQYPMLFDVLENFSGKVPILGVCLGHQTIGVHYGARLTKAKKPMHGKVSSMKHCETGLYRDVLTPTDVTRYHSLVLDQLPNCLLETGSTLEGEIMSLVHKTEPIWGLQYHPEAFLTKNGERIIENFTSIVSNYRGRNSSDEIANPHHLPKKEICW